MREMIYFSNWWILTSFLQVGLNDLCTLTFFTLQQLCNKDRHLRDEIDLNYRQAGMPDESV